MTYFLTIAFVLAVGVIAREFKLLRAQIEREAIARGHAIRELQRQLQALSTWTRNSLR